VARTINAAFETFLGDTVELTKSETDKARASRDYLIDQLMYARRSSASSLPLNGQWQPFGSFARKTKVRPLDDVDLLVHLTSENLAYSSYVRPWNNTRICPKSGVTAYNAFLDGNGDFNSRVVLNDIKRIFQRVPSYQQSEIKRNQQAVTINLKSYPWIFDVVPAIWVSDNNGGVEYYLIPNGEGNWMQTDPRRDQANVTRLNQQHGGSYLRMVRLLKYWNIYRLKPKLTSYHLETLVMRVFDRSSAIQSFSGALEEFFSRASQMIMGECADPKHLGGSLDSGLAWDTRNSIRNQMLSAHQIVRNARLLERQGEIVKALEQYGLIFGTSFPRYG
jgi:hypothetical protein